MDDLGDGLDMEALLQQFGSVEALEAYIANLPSGEPTDEPKDDAKQELELEAPVDVDLILSGIAPHDDVAFNEDILDKIGALDPDQIERLLCGPKNDMFDPPEPNIANGVTNLASSVPLLASSIPSEEINVLPSENPIATAMLAPNQIMSENQHKMEKRKEREGKRRQQEEAKRKKELNLIKKNRHPDFNKFKEKFRLLETSVTLVKIDTIIRVEKHMILKRRRLERIEVVDRTRQAKINKKEGRIRLVPRPQPAFEPYQSSSVRQKEEVKRRKIVSLSSDSDSSSGSPPPQTSTSKGYHGREAGTKMHKKFDRTASKKPYGEFSATGARILPFEKRAKDADRIIKRPKGPELDIRKENKNRIGDRFLPGIGSKESELKLRNLLATAQASNSQFRIPKNQNQKLERQSEMDRERVSTTSLNRGLNENQRLFGQKAAMQKYPRNSYGWYKYNQGKPGGNTNFGGFGNGAMNRLQYEKEQAAQEIQKRLMLRAEYDDDDDDETGMNMHDDGGSNDDEDEQPLEARPPIQSLQAGPLVVGVLRMLQFPVAYPSNNTGTPGNTEVQRETSLYDLTAQKCAWWFQGIDKSMVPPILPIPFNPEADDAGPMSDYDKVSVGSSFGNVSNPGGDECQINEITSSDQGRARDPDVIDEFCGCSLFGAQFRVSSDKFQNILEVKPGVNYDKENLQATCTICNEAIHGKRDLGRHLRSEDHRLKFKQISLSIMPRRDLVNELRVEQVSRNPPAFKGRTQEKPASNNADLHTREKGSSDKSKDNNEDKKTKNEKEVVNKVSRTPSEKRAGSVASKTSNTSKKSNGVKEARSRSPGRRRSVTSPARSKRSRSRSPKHGEHRRSRVGSRSPLLLHSQRRMSSEDRRVDEFLAKTRRRSRSRERTKYRSPSPIKRFKSSDAANFAEKLKLQAAGRWTPELEDRWKRMETDERAMLDQMENTRALMMDRPEDHPKYDEEWRKYWEKEYQNVEVSGKNPDTFDYIPGWKREWARRASDLFEIEVSSKTDEIRLKYGMDMATLQKLLIPDHIGLHNENQHVKMLPLGVDPLMHINNGKELYNPYEDDFVARSISLTGSGSGEPGPPGVEVAVEKKPIVTVDSVTKTWEMLTGQKINGSSKSEVSTGSGAEMDVDMELIEVLRLMNSLEDVLSFLAGQVKDYFSRAQNLELSGTRKSYELLENKDFVSLLFQCRDRFMGMIRSNVLTRDVLKRVNKTVFGLNSVLDLEPCQRLRPKNLTNESVGLDIVVAGPSKNVIEDPFGGLRRSPTSKVSNPMEEENEVEILEHPLKFNPEDMILITQIERVTAQISNESKVKIAEILATNLEKAKRIPMRSTDLVHYVYGILEPLILKTMPNPEDRLYERRPYTVDDAIDVVINNLECQAAAIIPPCVGIEDGKFPGSEVDDNNRHSSIGGEEQGGGASKEVSQHPPQHIRSLFEPILETSPKWRPRTPPDPRRIRGLLPTPRKMTPTPLFPPGYLQSLPRSGRLLMPDYLQQTLQPENNWIHFDYDHIQEQPAPPLPPQEPWKPVLPPQEPWKPVLPPQEPWKPVLPPQEPWKPILPPVPSSRPSENIPIYVFPVDTPRRKLSKRQEKRLRQEQRLRQRALRAEKRKRVRLAKYSLLKQQTEKRNAEKLEKVARNLVNSAAGSCHSSNSSLRRRKLAEIQQEIPLPPLNVTFNDEVEVIPLPNESELIDTRDQLQSDPESGEIVSSDDDFEEDLKGDEFSKAKLMEKFTKVKEMDDRRHQARNKKALFQKMRREKLEKWFQLRAQSSNGSYNIDSSHSSKKRQRSLQTTSISSKIRTSMHIKKRRSRSAIRSPVEHRHLERTPRLSNIIQQPSHFVEDVSEDDLEDERWTHQKKLHSDSRNRLIIDAESVKTPNILERTSPSFVSESEDEHPPVIPSCPTPMETTEDMLGLEIICSPQASSVASDATRILTFSDTEMTYTEEV